MLSKTTGIVIKNTKYGDNNLITKIFTRQFGMQTYMINGIQSAKAPIRASTIQPFNELEMVVYHSKTRQIHRIKEAKILADFHPPQNNMVKTGIAMFITEIINKSIKEEEPNEKVYEFISFMRKELFNSNLPDALFPHLFSIKLCSFLGFEPHGIYSEESCFFNLEEGRFTSTPTVADLCLDKPSAEHLSILITNHKSIENILQRKDRIYLLDKLMLYYSLHLPGFTKPKSIDILAALWN